MRALVLFSLLLAACHFHHFGGAAEGEPQSPPDLAMLDGKPMQGRPAPDGSVAVPDAGAVVAPDAGVVHDAAMPPALDASMPDLALPPPPPPPGTLTGVVILGAGIDFADVSTDEGGNVWGVTSARVYLFPRSGGGPFTYDQGSGLAHGQTTWQDSYWFVTPQNPGPLTEPVSFTSVAGGLAGEVVVGNIGYIADLLRVDAASGAVQSIEGLAVTSAQQPDPTELKAQQQRIVASWRTIVDLAGTFNGTAYLGGWHGTSGLHGIAGDCGCTPFEEHVHAFFNGNTQVAGGDVRALAITPAGDVWMGDRDVISFLPQRSVGARADLFQTLAIPGQPSSSSLDVFPGVRDENWGIALDASGGIYVASHVNGLAYLSAGNYAATFWTQSNGLPSNQLTSVAVDNKGDVWIASDLAGIARYSPAANKWAYYTTASGLPSNVIRQIYVDKYGAGARYFATGNGIAVYAGP